MLELLLVAEVASPPAWLPEDDDTDATDTGECAYSSHSACTFVRRHASRCRKFRSANFLSSLFAMEMIKLIPVAEGVSERGKGEV